MPNWCSNYIFIDANNETLEAIADFVRSEETDFDFNKIVPIPDSIYHGDLTMEKEGNWPDWRIEHWGSNRYIDVYANLDHYALDTAWAPCEPVIAELARLFPEARIVHRYDEPNMGFCGETIYQAGTLIYRMHGDMNCNWTAEKPEECDEKTLRDYLIEDELYPLQESGDLCSTTEDGHIYIRKYKNGRLFVKIDGTYEDYRPEGERAYYW